MGKNPNDWRPSREERLAIYAEGVNHELGKAFGVAPERIAVHSAVNESVCIPKRLERGYKGWLKVRVEWVDGDTWHLRNLYLSDENADELPITRNVVGSYAVTLEANHYDYTTINGIPARSIDVAVEPDLVTELTDFTHAQAPEPAVLSGASPELVAA